VRIIQLEAAPTGKKILCGWCHFPTVPIISLPLKTSVHIHMHVTHFPPINCVIVPWP